MSLVTRPRVIRHSTIWRHDSGWCEGPYTTGGSRRRDACPRFTQVGNAVPPLLAEALGEMLMGLLAVQKRNESPHLAESLSMLGEYPTDVRKIVDGDFAATL